MSLLRSAAASLLRAPRLRLSAVSAPAVRSSARALFPVAAPALSFHCSSAVRAAAPASSASSSSSVNPIKYTTNIAGLDVVPNAREVLMGLLQETIAAIEAYNKQHGVTAHNITHEDRSSTGQNAASTFEPLFNERVRKQSLHRLRICEEEESHVEIEKRIWYGQIETLIQHAEDELDLVVLMNEEVKPWIVDPAFEAEREEVELPNFGETVEEMRAQEPPKPSEAEKAASDAFWKEIDAEIAEDQKREAEERAARKKNKQ